MFPGGEADRRGDVKLSIYQKGGWNQGQEFINIRWLEVGVILPSLPFFVSFEFHKIGIPSDPLISRGHFLFRKMFL